MSTRSLLISALLVCLVLPAFAAAPLTDFISAASQLRLGDAASVSNAGFSVGHLKIKFASGSAARDFAGGKDNLLYEIDADDEYLGTAGPPRSYVDNRRVKQRLYSTILSLQPVGRDRATPARPPFVLTAIDYDLTADGDNVKAEMTE